MDNILVGKGEGKNHSEDLSVDANIISEWILGKQSGKMWTGFMLFRIGLSDRIL
jgi:hypothetical protein